MEEKITELKRLYELGKSGTSYTELQKKFIKDVSAEMQVPFVVRKNCKNCYMDQVLVLLNIIKTEQIKSGEIQPMYVLREPYATTGVRVNGAFISQETLTDEIAERMVSLGIGNLFIKK